MKATIFGYVLRITMEKKAESTPPPASSVRKRKELIKVFPVELTYRELKRRDAEDNACFRLRTQIRNFRYWAELDKNDTSNEEQGNTTKTPNQEVG